MLMRRSRASLVAASVLAVAVAAACAGGVPVYVRGEVASRSTERLERGASYALSVEGSVDEQRRALVASAVARLLDPYGWTPAAADSAQLAVAVTIREYEEPSAGELVASSDRTPRRVVIEVRRAGEPSPSAALWRAELRSDGPTHRMEDLLGGYLRILLSSLGRDRAPAQFALRVGDPQHALATAATAATPAPARELRAPDASSAPIASPSEPGADAKRAAQNETGAERPTASHTLRSLFGNEPSPPQPAQARASAPAHATSTEAAASEGSFERLRRRQLGPDLERVRRTCRDIDARQAVSCAIEHGPTSRALRLRVAYATEAQAEREWPGDGSQLRLPFCRAAESIDRVEQATVYVAAGRSERSIACRELTRRPAPSPSPSIEGAIE